MSKGMIAISAADLMADAELRDALLELNNAHEAALSWLEPERFLYLLAQAFLAARLGTAEAMLLAFDQDAEYDSPNFLWFRQRLRRFVYVDRIVVAAGARGRGLARCLYEHLFASARAAGHDQVVCEVNSNPPNPDSDAFHAALGFTEIGGATLPGGGKTVRYLRRPLTMDAASRG